MHAMADAKVACLTDFEALAQERINRNAWEYIHGGAGDEYTVRWNREAYERLQLMPRVLTDVSRIDTSVELFGRKYPNPILLAPTAYHKLVHHEGEIATARGASEAGAFVVSSFANFAIEEIVKVASGPVWFQLYAQRDRGFTRELVARAVQAGCEALCLTVDTPVLGMRNREERCGFTLPDDLSRPNLAGLIVEGKALSASSEGHRPPPESIYSALANPELAWGDVDWLRSTCDVPVLLKGILNPEDAKRAVERGASGIVVSNHGGRNLDTLPATAAVLPYIADVIQGRVPILVDGGIRRGTDVLKALALGADAVMIGRPYLYGLAVDGADGVARAVGILKRELEMALALTGRSSVAELDRTVLWLPNAAGIQYT